MDARLILDGSAEGAWNMAADEVLLENARSGLTTLRFYSWSELTLSLGYFQPAAQRISKIATVRRSTGGGAILHGTDLTYSFTCPALSRTDPDPLTLYTLFHQALIQSLSKWGITGELCSGDDPNEHEFLCFRRREAGDVVAASKKIGGSAQRRQRGAVLLHGSVILRSAPLVPDVVGVLDLIEQCGAEFQRTNALDATSFIPSLIDAWGTRIARALDLEWRPESWSELERKRIQELVVERFGNPVWIDRR